MRISTVENNVAWKIFPRNIPEEYIGDKAQNREELINTMICETKDDTSICRQFITDFIDSGYGEKRYGGNGWIIALDLQDVTEVLRGEMHYYKFKCDGNEVPNTFLNFLAKINIKDAKSLLICVCNDSCEENKLSLYNAIMEIIYGVTSENCVIAQQCVMGKNIEKKTVINIICS